MISFQRQSDQPISLICHKQRDVQHIVIQLQIVQRESHTEPDLLREQLLELSKAFACDIRLGLDLHGENVVLPLDQEINLIGRVALAPIAELDLILRQGLTGAVDPCDAI